MIRADGLETVLQRLHVRVLVVLQLKARRDDLDVPRDTRRRVVGFEHEREVARMAAVDGESVGAALGVGFGVSAEPGICEVCLLAR